MSLNFRLLAVALSILLNIVNRHIPILLKVHTSFHKMHIEPEIISLLSYLSESEYE